EVREDQRADDHGEQHGGHAGGVDEDVEALPEPHAAPDDGEHAGKGGADARRLGRGEHAQVDAADHDQEQGGHAPYAAQDAQAFAPGGAFSGRPGGGIAQRHDIGGHTVKGQADQTRYDAGDEQLVDVGVGHDAVQHQRDRRRNEY